MRTTRPYRIAAEKLNNRGLRAFMMRPHQLVFTRLTRRGGGWLTFHNEKWYISTWRPKLYRLDKKADLVPLCHDFLKAKSSFILNPELVAKYNLIELSDDEMTAMVTDTKGPA